MRPAWPLRVAALLLAALFAAAPSRAEPLVLAHHFSPPYVDPARKDGGVAAQVVRRLLAEQGFAVEIAVLTRRETLDGAIAGRHDGIVGASHSADRAPFLAFSEPYMVNRVFLFSTEDAPAEVRALSDLRGATVGVIDGYAYPADLMTSSLFQRVVESDNLLNMKKLARGRIDFAVEEEHVGWRLMRRLEEEGRTDGVRLRAHPLLIAERGVRIAITRKRPDHQRIVDGVNAAIAAGVASP